MVWDYRVIRQNHPTGTTYAIYEVYYDDQGNILFIGKNPENPQGETLAELTNDLKCMRQALKRPLLDMDEVLKCFRQSLIRQSRIIQNDPSDMLILDAFAEIADWGDEPSEYGKAVVEYPAILTPAEEGGFLVDFPDFEGEAFTEGDTLEEALHNAADVLSLVVEARRKRGLPIPEPGRRIDGPNIFLVPLA